MFAVPITHELIVAYIGAVTGVFSLVWLVLSSRAKLKLTFLSLIFTKTESEPETFTYAFTAINVGRKPLSIVSVQLLCDDQVIRQRHLTSVDNPLLGIGGSNRFEFTYYLNQKQTKIVNQSECTKLIVHHSSGKSSLCTNLSTAAMHHLESELDVPIQSEKNESPCWRFYLFQWIGSLPLQIHKSKFLPIWMR